MNAAMFDVLRGMAGEDRSRVIVRTFDLIEIAEQLITAIKRKYPSRADVLHRAFLLLHPKDAVVRDSDVLYRAHANELLLRVAREEDTRPGTLAECLACMSITALRAPLNPEGDSVTRWLLREVNAGIYAKVYAGDLEIREKYPGAIEEMLYTLRRQRYAEDRVMPC